MIEKKLIHEIPKSADFHSAVLTSFSFDFHHFESQVLRQLKSKGIINVNIFADDVMLDQAIGLSTGYLKSISSSYVVNGASSVGAFHPKIIFLAGEKDIMMIQGSGNITNGGHGKNHEVFGVFYANSDNKAQLPIIQETWNFLKVLGERAEGISRDKISWLEDNCGLLNNDTIDKHSWSKLDNNLSAAAVYNDEKSIWHQIQNLIPNEEIKGISIYSPFYDEAGSFIKNLSDHYIAANIRAFIQSNKGIHPHKMERADNVGFFAWESTRRAESKVKKLADRKLHSKVFVFEATNGAQYCLFGSPNATVKAFGTDSSRGANDEFGIVFKSKTRNFIDELALDGTHKKVTPKEQPLAEKAEKEINDQTEKRVGRLKITGVDQDGNILSIYLKNKKDIKSANCILFDAWGKRLEESNLALGKDKILYELKDQKNASKTSFIQFFNNEKKEVSNKQIVNSLSDIINTNPSQENRKLLRLASIIELGNDKVFEVIDFMNTLRSARTPEDAAKSYRSDSNEKKDKNATSLSYDEIFSMEEEELDFKKTLNQHNSIRIWDAIEKYFNQLATEEVEEDMDDEEEGDATISRTRKEKKNRTEAIILRSTNVLNNKRKAIEKFLVNYHNALKNSAIKGDHEIGLIDMAMFLIVMKQLIQFTEREVTLKVIKEEEGEKFTLYPSTGNLSELTSFTGATLNILGQFVNLINRFEFQSSNDEYTAQKLSHYKKLVYRSSLFVLSITKQLYDYHPNGSKWTDTVAYNIVSKLGDIESNLEDHFEELLKNVSIEELHESSLINHVKKWSDNLKTLKGSSYLLDKQLGICNIEKKIPVSGPPKYLKISRPGFEYNEDVQDFLLSDLYECQTKKLKPSLQKFKSQQLN